MQLKVGEQCTFKFSDYQNAQDFIALLRSSPQTKECFAMFLYPDVLYKLTIQRIK